MFDLFSEGGRRNPYPFYAHLREFAPLLHVPTIDAWMVFDYDGVKRVLADHEAFGSRMGPEWLAFTDPPRHTKLRALIAKAFTPRAVAQMEGRIRALSGELLDRVMSRGEMDLVADYAVPLPMGVIVGMVGVPAGDHARFRAWSDVILQLSYDLLGGEAKGDAVANFRTVTAEMSAYLARLIEARRSDPTDDLLSGLVAAEVDGERLTEREIVGFVQLLLVGGQETTANLIGNAVLCFVEHPEELARVRADAGLLPSAIEEVLRYRSPFQWTPRVTRREVELHGQTIPAGKRVLAFMGSANRDPRAFAGPDRFDVGRSPNPHVAFGHGVHFCMGASLTRLEARIALEDLLGRMRRIELASADPWEPRRALHVHGPTRLPIRFE